MALIDSLANSSFYFNTGRSLVLAYGTIYNPEIALAQENNRVERIFYQTLATVTASFALEALPLGVFKGTLVGSILPFSPVIFTTTALATLYFRPEEMAPVLRFVEVTAIALSLVAAALAPSAVTLGSLAYMGAVFLQAKESNNPSHPIHHLKFISQAIGAIGLVYTLKETITSFTLQYALYAVSVLSVAIFVQLKELQNIALAPEISPPSKDEQVALSLAYKKALPEAFKNVVKDRQNELEKITGIKFTNYPFEIKKRWLEIIQNENDKALVNGLDVEEGEMPKDITPYNEWLFGCYTYSKKDMGPMRSLYSLLSAETSLEKLLEEVHKKTMHQAIPAQMVGGATPGEALRPEVTSKIFYLFALAQGLTLF